MTWYDRLNIFKYYNYYFNSDYDRKTKEEKNNQNAIHFYEVSQLEYIDHKSEYETMREAIRIVDFEKCTGWRVWESDYYGSRWHDVGAPQKKIINIIKYQLLPVANYFNISLSDADVMENNVRTLLMKHCRVIDNCYHQLYPVDEIIGIFEHNGKIIHLHFTAKHTIDPF